MWPKETSAADHYDTVPIPSDCYVWKIRSADALCAFLIWGAHFSFLDRGYGKVWSLCQKFL